ncbi:unnamed protein product [Rhizophagus irregularis]|nr:unnamed protein product [Rhizophagus irregularis]
MLQANLREQTRSTAVDSNSAAIGEPDQQLGEAQGNSAVAGHSRSASGSRVEWDAIMEIEFCRAIIKNRPVGIHRHFRMVNIHHDFNANSPVKCSIPELWEQFSKYYNIEKLEELEREFDDEGDEDGPYTEFTLPMEEYYNLIAENRKVGSSRSSPRRSPHRSPRSSPSNYSRSSSRSMSPAPISSPESEDTKKGRRTRNARKSDASETVRTPAPAKRGRARKTSDVIPTSTRSSKRGGRRKQKHIMAPAHYMMRKHRQANISLISPVELVELKRFIMVHIPAIVAGNKENNNFLPGYLCQSENIVEIANDPTNAISEDF